MTDERAMARYLLIVAPDQPDLCAYLTRNFAPDEKVRVLLDRRRGERRQRVQAHEQDRRCTKRRYQAGFGLGLVMIRKEQPPPRVISGRASSVADFRRMHFSDYQPAPASKGIDAAVAIEANFSPRAFLPHSLREVTEQVIAEDLATIFTKPSFDRRGGEAFIVRADIGWTPSRRALEVTVTVLDAATGTTRSSHNDSVQHTETSLIMGRLVSKLLPGLKENLVKAFHQLTLPPAEA